VIFLSRNSPYFEHNQPYIIFEYGYAVETSYIKFHNTKIQGHSGSFSFSVRKFDAIDASIIIMDKYRGRDQYYYFVSQASGDWQEYF